MIKTDSLQYQGRTVETFTDHTGQRWLSARDLGIKIDLEDISRNTLVLVQSQDETKTLYANVFLREEASANAVSNLQ